MGIEVRYSHLAKRDTPARKANRDVLQSLIEEIQAEPVEVECSGPTLRLAARYAKGKIHKSPK